ncbi:MAG: hypothetical protein R3B06_32765 [Kofleriaceae bacterium]
MTLMMPSLVRRHLKQSERFVRSEERDALPPGISIPPGEALVGWYRNPSPWDGDIVVFTDCALYSKGEGEGLRIAWDEIVDYETPKSKVDVTGVLIRTPGGVAFVRMAGAHGPEGKFKDVFGLVMLLNTLVNLRRNSLS